MLLAGKNASFMVVFIARSCIAESVYFIYHSFMPKETQIFLLALFIGTNTPTVWVRNSINLNLLFFIVKLPENVLQ